MYRWWLDLHDQLDEVAGRTTDFFYIKNSGAVGRVSVGRGSVLSHDAQFNGNVQVGKNCLIGNGVLLRGTVKLGDNVQLGYGVEIKDSVIKDNSTIGPMCYLGNSLVEENVYLGAMVRTSNHRLDRQKVVSWNGEFMEDTGLEKLGSWIKSNTSLGIGIIILPGRIIPSDSIFEPNLVIKKNYSSGVYKNNQQIIKE